MAQAESGATPVTVRAVETKQDLDRFIRVPFALFQNDPQWVPPLMMERRDHLNRNKNPYFEHAETQFWIAEKEGRPAGRLSAQVDRAYLDKHQDATGCFGFFDAADDPAVVVALLDTAAAWLRDRGMERMRGPFSLSINDESGVLVDGFDRPPSLMMPYGRPYYAERLEQAGLSKAMDLIAFLYNAEFEMPAVPRALVKKLETEPSVRIRQADMSQFDRDIAIVLDIFNDAWADNWGFVPFTEAEVAFAAHSMKPLVERDLVHIAEVDGDPAAMIVGLPNLNEAIADLNGALLPFGWIKLLWRLKVTGLKSARVPLLGVRRKYQGTMLGSALVFGVIDRIRASFLRRGTREVEMSWILEENAPMRRVAEALGAAPYKTYRVYERDLT